MWVLSNSTPFSAERALVSDSHGSDVWVVAVKATWSIHADGLTIAEDQEDVLLAPVFRGDALQTSLLYESDLDYAKPQTDVYLHGHAYAPAGRPATQVDVAMRVGPISKQVRVFGNRFWKQQLYGLAPTPPEPFIKMPLCYENAFGGTDISPDDPQVFQWNPGNPIGRGVVFAASRLLDRPLPNVEDPQQVIKSCSDRPNPIGLGPIARHWEPRVRFAGTYDENWESNRQPLLPSDFDERFFQCAPIDQQAELRGGELVELKNLSPDGELTFELPRCSFGFDTLLDGEKIHHRAKLHTVVIEPDVPRLMMVWHTALPCQSKKYKLLATSVFEKKRN